MDSLLPEVKEELERIIKKATEAASALFEEEKAFLRARRGYLNKDQTKALKPILEEKPAEPQAPADEGEKNPEPEAPSEPEGPTAATGPDGNAQNDNGGENVQPESPAPADGEQTQETPVAPEPQAPAPETPAPTDTHTVQEGDTLISIAALHGIPDAQLLAQANGINDVNEEVAVGRVLNLPTPATQPANPEPQPEVPAPAEPAAPAPEEDHSADPDFQPNQGQ